MAHKQPSAREMNGGERLRKKLPLLQVIGLYLAISSVLTYLDAIAAVRDYRRAGGVAIWEPVTWSATSIFMICLLAFGIYRFVEVTPIGKRNWVGALLKHLAASLVFSAVHIFAMVLLRKGVYLVMGSEYRFGDWWSNFTYEYSKDIITYASIAVISYTHLFWKRYTQATLKTLALEADLASLKLRRLQEQLRPHFLFNTLNHISSCMYEDVEKADRLLADLCTLLRYGLKEEHQMVVRLEEELRFLELYLDLMNQRFSGGLHTEILVDPGLEQAKVPQFLLQPLAENAIQHGFESRNGKGRILVRIRGEGERLRIVVEDNGTGLPPGFAIRGELGLGLGNTRAVLEKLYPNRHEFRIAALPEGGTLVHIDLPLEALTPEETESRPGMGKGATVANSHC